MTVKFIDANNVNVVEIFFFVCLFVFFNQRADLGMSLKTAQYNDI